MKPRFFLRLSLFAVLAASCASATATTTPEPSASALIERTATVPALSTQTVTVIPTDPQAPTPLPAATSRGPNLEATDPTTVKMASGGLQLVEFFEFW